MRRARGTEGRPVACADAGSAFASREPRVNPGAERPLAILSYVAAGSSVAVFSATGLRSGRSSSRPVPRPWLRERPIRRSAAQNPYRPPHPDTRRDPGSAPGVDSGALRLDVDQTGRALAP